MRTELRTFSIIIPTMWKSDKLLKMLQVYENSKYVGEVVIIDNEPKNKLNLDRFKKIKYYTLGYNIFVNPSWNLGYTLSKYETVLANDDIYIENLDLVFDNIIKNDFDIIGINIENNSGKIEIQNIKDFPKNSYGCFMYVKNYTYIPEKFKIWCGDDILFNRSKKRGIILNSGIITDVSATVNADGKKLRNEIATKDLELFKNYKENKPTGKILAVLVNYGGEQIDYLKRVVNELKSFNRYQVTIIVNSNINLDINGVDKVNVFDNLNNYQLLPLTCRKTIWENKDNYDLFIYGENDHLFLETHIDKHIEYSKILPNDRICGLFQYENKEYDYYYPAYHAHFDWDYNSLETYDNKKFAHFTNVHQASFILTKNQLLNIGKNKDFTSFFGKSKYSVKCQVNTDIYEMSGMKKVICVSEFKENLIHHLPNLYIDGDKGRNKGQRAEDDRMKESIYRLFLKKPKENKLINGFYLNLDKRADRKEKMEIELLKTKHNIVRYPALDGDKIKDTGKFKGTIQNSHAKQYATYLSHLNMLKRARDLNWEYVIILEDDLTLCDDFDYRLDLFLSQLPQNWTIGYLGFNGYSDTKIEKVTEYVHKLVDAFGCFGMIIKGSFLNTLINVIENNNVAVDEIIRVHIQHKYPCYAFIPFFMYINDDYSDLWNKVRVLDKIKKYFRSTTHKSSLPTKELSKIVILSTLWNAKRFLHQYVNSIKNQTYKNFVVYVVDDNSNDGSYEVLLKLTSDDNRFKIFKNTSQKFKTQNFYEIINNRNLINDNDIVIELDGDDSFYGKNVIEKVNNDFKDPNLWIAGYKWIDNRGKRSPFRHSPNADNPRSQTWAYSAMRVFKAFLFRNIKENDLMFEGKFIKAANDVAYGMPMLEMSGKEHFKSFNDITYLYNWHDKNTHTKTSSVKDTGLQKRTEKHIYSLPRYDKLKLPKVLEISKNIRVIPKVTNVTNSEKINKIKNIVKVNKVPDTPIVTQDTKLEVKKVLVNENIKIPNNSNIRKLVSQIVTSTKESDNRYNLVNNVDKNKIKVIDHKKIEEFKNREVKSNPKVRFDNFIVKPQNKEEINKKREEFENILLFGPNGKKQINPIPPKSIGVSI